MGCLGFPISVAELSGLRSSCFFVLCNLPLIFLACLCMNFCRLLNQFGLAHSVLARLPLLRRAPCTDVQMSTGVCMYDSLLFERSIYPLLDLELDDQKKKKKKKKKKYAAVIPLRPR